MPLLGSCNLMPISVGGGQEITPYLSQFLLVGFYHDQSSLSLFNFDI